jgi:hypothetical protein
MMTRQAIYPEQWTLTDKAKTLPLAHPHGNGFDPACPWCLQPKGMKVKAWYESMPDGVLVNEWYSLKAARGLQHCRNGAFHDMTIVIPLMEGRGLLQK